LNLLWELAGIILVTAKYFKQLFDF